MKYIVASVAFASLAACSSDSSSDYSYNSGFQDPQLACREHAETQVSLVGDDIDITDGGRDRIVESYYEECLRKTAVDIERFETIADETNIYR